MGMKLALGAHVTSMLAEELLHLHLSWMLSTIPRSGVGQDDWRCVCFVCMCVYAHAFKHMY